MKCPGCLHDNAPSAKFCQECGAKLVRACVACETVLDATAKFCPECGTRVSAASSSPETRRAIDYTPEYLAEQIRSQQQAMEARGSSEGERKTITALFADLKGSTAMIEQLDPEEARAIIDPALQLMMDAIHRYEGFVAQAMGDGILALFGAPIAHEDHPERALRAALDMRDAMKLHSDRRRRIGEAPLQMRIGINTGEVVVRSIRKDDLHTDYVPVGHSTNLAARLEQLAPPGSILVSEHTMKLAKEFFDFKSLGRVTLKGIAQPMDVYEAVGLGAFRTRLQAAENRGFSRYVGRERELELIHQGLTLAISGRGQIVGVMGEPGLGKSRLFHEFKQTLPHQILLLEAQAISHGGSSPYLPVTEMLKPYFQIQPTDEELTRRDKITVKIRRLDRTLEGILPYLFAMFGLDDTNSPLRQMEPLLIRQRIFDAVKSLLLRESALHPVVITFEDLHWIDNETQGLLDALGEGLAGARVLLLVNYRPEYRHQWGQKTYYSQARLSPLGPTEAHQLLDNLLSLDADLGPLKDLIVERTEGTPFFMEEVIQALAELGAISGARGRYQLNFLPDKLAVPQTVQGVLAARIDRLAANEKQLLQQLAVLGRRFPLPLVCAVVDMKEEELRRLLSALQAKEFVFEQPGFPDTDYLFKHALTQEVAYGTLLVESRKLLHERTARALESLYAENLDEHCTELAHHYTCSGNPEKAIEYLRRAADQAVKRGANGDAVTMLTRALSLLGELPVSRRVNRIELSLQVALGTPLAATRGYGVPEVERVYLRARELATEELEVGTLFPILFGYFRYSYVKARLRTANQIADELLELALSEAEEGVRVVVACGSLSMVLFSRGQLAEALEFADRGIRLFDQETDSAEAYGHGWSPGVACRSYAAWILWIMGYPERASRINEEAIRLAEASSHTNSVVWALSYSAWIQQIQGDIPRTREHAERAIVLSREHGFPLWEGWTSIPLGWARAVEGELEAGLEMSRAGSRLYIETAGEWSLPYALGVQAELELRAGRVEAGLEAVARGLEACTANDDRWYEAELFRLRGEFVLADPEEAAAARLAEESFVAALSVASRQQAKAWELRAAVSFAKLLRDQNRISEARAVLAPVYGWFSEGFDTIDAKQAKALLDELSVMD